MKIPKKVRTSSPSKRVLVLRTMESKRRRLLASVLAALAALAVAGVGLIWVVWVNPTARSPRGTVAKPVRKVALPASAQDLDLILDTDVMAIAPEKAKDLNDKRPLDIATLTAAKPFTIGDLPIDDPHVAAAITCLAQAVYYEASGEGATGQRAVAQVVLNRVRHPAFPNTVCGVVFQGSKRVTGCQFSFTCDGALYRIPSTSGFNRARQIAREALTGTVEPSVGTSTHYHANYVVPYWAPTLDKAKQLGTHIFYQIRGALGSARAFTMQYNPRAEFLPGETTLVETMPDGAPSIELGPEIDAKLPATSPVLNADVRAGKIVTATGNALGQPRASSPLRADSESGTLNVAAPKLNVDENDQKKSR